MITLEGQSFDGCQPIAVPATLVFTGQEAILTIGPTSETYHIGQLKVSPRIGRADRFISLPNGKQFKCADQVFPDSLPEESQSEGLVAWLEERWGVALVAVVIIFSSLVAGYFYGLPAAAELVAARIPIVTEQSLGQQTLVWLDNNKWLKPTGLDMDKQKSILTGFYELCSDLPLKSYYRLEFRNSGFMGPNAFALPGGTIVITDDMIKFTESPDEVMAVLAHEIGHVELRHTIRSVLQNSIVAVAAATVTSDAASLSVAVAGLPALLAQTKYSREFETEADDYTFRLLKQKGCSPAAFASLMDRLAKKYEQEEHIFAFVSTHPVTADRVNRARDSAQEQRSQTQVIQPQLSVDVHNEISNYSSVIKFNLIPAGSFVMGSPTNQPGRLSNETQHQVTISRPFYMQTTPVTQGQWKAVMGSNPSSFKDCGDDCPVENVSWNDVQEFINRLNRMEKTYKYRLPTEAEWEYVARAGSQTAYYFGDSDDNLGDFSWYHKNSEDKTHSVGLKKPNARGLYDLYGNVWQWVQDRYSGDYPSTESTDPTGALEGSLRVLRGGRCYYNTQQCRSAYRNSYDQNLRNEYTGFRLARTF